MVSFCAVSTVRPSRRPTSNGAITAYHAGVPGTRGVKETAELVTRWTPMAPGEYVLTAPLRVPSGTTVDLTHITLRYPANARFRALLTIEGARGVEIIGGTFDGNVDEQPKWREHHHAIQVRGSTHVNIHGGTFVNLSGDGVLVSEASTSVRIHHCTFRGQNTNRNGVSITNAQVCRVTDCHFEGMTRPDMPGPIDLEPDVPSERVADILIARNEIVGTGQPVQAAITIYNAIANATIANITIEQNTIWNSFQRAIWVVGGGTGREQNIVVRNNSIRDLPTREPIQIQDAQASVSGNIIEPPREPVEQRDPTNNQQRRHR